MKKAGLCVRYDCNNYGSMLQILATQKVIERMGWEYEIIRYNKKTLMFMVKNLTRLFNPYFMRGVRMGFSKRKKMRKHPDVMKMNAKRLSLISEYRKAHIGPYSSVYKGYKNLVKATKNYDAFIVGSDQLWTPAGITSKFYNLLFVPDNIKKISFATSFGVNSVPKNQVKMTSRYLKRIDYLSVRETTGAEIVKKLTSRNATVALDPTLLLSGDEWQKVFPEKKMCEEPYIFSYFLGTNAEHRKAVTELSKKTGIKIVTCPHFDEFVDADIDFGDEQRYDIDPVGFLNLIRGAEYICTDSFHGSVFSILNHKKFLTFNRFNENEKQSRNSRIESLFSLLGLEARRCSDLTYLEKKLNENINYDLVDQKLNCLREETFEFLDNALNKD